MSTEKLSNENETSNGILGAVMCCDSFKKFIPTFGWMQTEEKICLMPYIQCGNLKMRINHCPSCGKEVRNIQLTEDELMSFFL